MLQSPQHFTKSVAPENNRDSTSVPVDRMERLTADWLADCQIRQHSPRTIELRRMLLGRLQWFLLDRNYSECSRSELRLFFAYLSSGHQDAAGRWGKGQGQQWTGALRPATVSTYFRHLRAFFSYLVGEEFITA